MKVERFESFLKHTESALTDYNFYLQSFAAISSIIIVILFYKIIKYFFRSKWKEVAEKRSHFFKKQTSFEDNIEKLLIKYFAPLFLPAAILIALFFGMAISSIFFGDIIVFHAVIQLVTLFIFLRFIRIISSSTFIANIFGVFLVPIVILNFVGLLDATISYLDQFALNIGQVRISIYNILHAIITLITAFWFSRLISKNIKNFINKNRTIRSTTKGILTKIVDIAIYLIIFGILMKVFGFNMTTFAVFSGAIGVGLGFGLQRIVANFIGGIILLFEKSVEIGNVVELEDGAVYGKVSHFGGRYTLIETMDGKEIMIPNEDLITKKVVNLTYSNNKARVEIDVNVAFDTDLEKVQNLILNISKDHPKCLRFPEAKCYIYKFDDYAVKIRLFFWISDVSDGIYEPRSEVMVKIWNKLKEEGVKIPYPKRDITNNIF
jgi:small-conductance mechanosensitive channel